MPYMKTWNEVTQYMFSLNINPNFHNAIHDRIIRSIQYGTLPITENGKWCHENFGDLIPYYDYRTLSIEDIIMNYDYKNIRRTYTVFNQKLENLIGPML